MKVLKFGGSSLINEKLPALLDIVQRESSLESVALVVSARGKSTDQLIELYKLALDQKDFSEVLEQFKMGQQIPGLALDLQSDIQQLEKLLYTVRDFQLEDDIIFDRVLSYGEWLSARTITAYLDAHDLPAQLLNSADLIRVEEGEVDLKASSELITAALSSENPLAISVITGFYGSDKKGRVRTLGRNGSNYSATVIGASIGASEVQNWTDVNSIYSADPRLVEDAVPIAHMSYKEAHELSNFGVNLLHSKTILPLMKSEIPLRIKNTSDPQAAGTLIDKDGAEKGIKAVSCIEDVSLIKISGKGLNGRIGIDGRIFSRLSASDISIRIISQASSERGIGFVVDRKNAPLATSVLQSEFEEELNTGDISSIETLDEVVIIAIVGRHNYALEKAIQVLRKNRVWMHLISNSISGEHISLVVDKAKAQKAMQVVHAQVFGVIKTLNVFAIGKGLVGGAFIDQIIETSAKVEANRALRVQVIGVADSQGYVVDEKGLGVDWRQHLEGANGHQGDLLSVLDTLKQSGIENLVVADNTASEEVTALYPEIIRSGFDLVASNKKGNSGDQESYDRLRTLLRRCGRHFFYETNVGAGLPVIDPLKHLRDSADELTRIRGIFSGSLSFLFSTFCAESRLFSEVLLEAQERGYTEPDPREDLSGMDVARKLLILAREVGIKAELEDVQIEPLIPEELASEESFDAFLEKRDFLDRHYEDLRHSTSVGEVLRYIGDLDVGSGTLRVSLGKVPTSSALGGLRGADAIFEIFTASYQDRPIIIQGAGAGAEVTARGVYSDLLRIGALI
ncbi:bifunctional aspartate kinase/homoserine dehydrogenase I [Cryomorphaceae bacterium]|nr:bifunctional aspartate kinase/homoserine dehydrogenase I [Cryomorphaceae bacterium]